MRAHALPLLICLATGCERNVRAFDAFHDAGRDPSDAAQPTDASFPRAPPRFGDAGAAADYAALARAFDGPFDGETRSTSEPARFTLELRAAERGRGTFRVRCKDAVACDPFGLGSSMDDADGTFSLITVDAGGRGTGQLAWGHGLTAVLVEFWSLEAHDDGALSFVVGHVGLSRELGFYSSVRLTPDRSAP